MGITRAAAWVYAGEDTMVCPRCRAEIPGDSTFCPMCGGRAPAPAEADVRAAEAGPRAASGPGAPAIGPRTTPMPSPEPGFVQAPGPAALPHAPGMPHRHGAVSGPPVASAPLEVPVTPSRARIAVGGVALLAALWVAVFSGRSLPAEIHGVGFYAAGALAIAGLVLVVTGALYRAQAEALCRRCARRVVGWKVAFGLQCPLGPHHARIHYPLVVLTGLFWAGALVAAILALVWFG